MLCNDVRVGVSAAAGMGVEVRGRVGCELRIGVGVVAGAEVGEVEEGLGVG